MLLLLSAVDYLYSYNFKRFHGLCAIEQYAFRACCCAKVCDSAQTLDGTEENIVLSKAVMQKLAENGGKAPESLKH